MAAAATPLLVPVPVAVSAAANNNKRKLSPEQSDDSGVSSLKSTVSTASPSFSSPKEAPIDAAAIVPAIQRMTISSFAAALTDRKPFTKGGFSVLERARYARPNEQPSAIWSRISHALTLSSSASAVGSEVTSIPVVLKTPKRDLTRHPRDESLFTSEIDVFARIQLAAALTDDSKSPAAATSNYPPELIHCWTVTTRTTTNAPNYGLLLEDVTGPNLLQFLTQHFTPATTTTAIASATAAAVATAAAATASSTPAVPLTAACDVHLPYPVIVKWLTSAARALAFLHDRCAIVHRDVKAANLLLTAGSDILTAADVKLCDFGLSRPLLATATAAAPATDVKFGSTAAPIAAVAGAADAVPLRLFDTPHINDGTPAYLSPEQWRNDKSVGLTDRIDSYAFGALIFTVLSGHEPWRGVRANAIMSQVVNERKRPRLTDAVAHVTPPALIQLMADCYEYEPCDRPAMRQIVHRLTTHCQPESKS